MKEEYNGTVTEGNGQKEGRQTIIRRKVHQYQKERMKNGRRTLPNESLKVAQRNVTTAASGNV